MPTRGAASGGRQCAGTLLGAGRCADEMGGWAIRTLRPRGVRRGCPGEAVGDPGRGDTKMPTDRGVAESDSEISRLVPKPGTDKWRLVLDCRWLRTPSARSACKMETLKLLWLARRGHLFGLAGGHHMLRVHPPYEKFMQFGLRGDLMQCSALPSGGWKSSARIFANPMRGLWEAIRALQASSDRTALRKLRRGSRPQWRLVSRRCGGRGNLAHLTARVLPYMGDFVVLCDSKAEALRW
ncbi:hypothetical protein CYMTET_15811 [Cymbomonas tetramitiformis]|uniref:Uncharacterized protein n=1 Tax=Cymbomonas tetramitiformis TaxID=36881 RepID=A0AAE0GDH2_9CHLO|nr:hypothetical protein CYMTET_15811 [Cymbomonas tetramitiformis]